MGRLGKIASMMLVVGFIGVLFMMQTGVEQSFRTPEMRSATSWEEGLLGFGSLLLFFGGALLYVFDWVRAKRRR